MALVHLWELEESSAPLVDQVDAVPLTNVTGTIATVTGKVGLALDAGTALTSVRNTTATLALAGAEAATVMCWVHPLATALAAIMTPGSLSEPLGLLATTTGPKFRVIWGTTGSNLTIDSDTNYSINTWYHIASVFQRNADSFIVINGGSAESTATAPDAPLSSTVGMAVGALESNALAINAYIDQIAMFDHALTEEAIRYIYNGGEGRSLHTYPGVYPDMGIVGFKRSWSN